MICNKVLIDVTNKKPSNLSELDTIYNEVKDILKIYTFNKWSIERSVEKDYMNSDIDSLKATANQMKAKMVLSDYK